MSFPALSSPAFSTPAVWCRIFRSRIFRSRIFSVPLCTVCIQLTTKMITSAAVFQIQTNRWFVVVWKLCLTFFRINTTRKWALNFSTPSLSYCLTIQTLTALIAELLLALVNVQAAWWAGERGCRRCDGMRRRVFGRPRADDEVGQNQLQSGIHSSRLRRTAHSSDCGQSGRSLERIAENVCSQLD